MRFEVKSLKELSIHHKGTYGIAASAVPYSTDLYTYLRITDINDDGTINKDGLMSVANERASEYLLHPNDIVFARTGASTGRNYFYDGTDGEFVYAGFLIKFSIDPSLVNPYFVKYHCLSDNYHGWIRSFNTGSTRGNINAQTFGNMPIKLPPREQQDKMVEILSSLDDKIKVNVAINKNLEEQAQAIFKAWFVDFEPFGEVAPIKWKYIPLGKIADISSGKRPPTKSELMTKQDNIPVVGASNIMGYTNNANHIDKILVIGRVGTHGIVQRFNSPCWASDNTLVVTSKYYEYVYQILCRIDYTVLNRGSTQPLITQGDMKKIPILFPDENTIEEFEQLAGTLMLHYERNIIENKRLSTIRDALLPRLMSGEIDVSGIEVLPNSLMEAIADSRDRRNLYGPFDSAEDAVASMLED